MGSGDIQNFDDLVLWEYAKVTPKKFWGSSDKQFLRSKGLLGGGGIFLRKIPPPFSANPEFGLKCVKREGNTRFLIQASATATKILATDIKIQYVLPPDRTNF